MLIGDHRKKSKENEFCEDILKPREELACLIAGMDCP